LFASFKEPSSIKVPAAPGLAEVNKLSLSVTNNLYSSWFKSIPYFDNPTMAFLPSGDPRLLSKSSKISGLIVTTSPVLFLSTFINPLVNESVTATLDTPELICVVKVSLDVNFISPLIFADTLLGSLTFMNNFEFFSELLSLNFSKFCP